MALLLRALIFVAIGVVVWKILQPRYRIKIVMDCDGVKSHMGIPDGKQSVILSFLARTVITDRAVTIGISRGSGGQPNFHFSGPIDPDTRQLVRNFLLSEL